MVRSDNPHVYDWFVCEDPKKDNVQGSHKLKIFSQMDISRNNLAEQCSFHIKPIAANENQLQNCKNVVDATAPQIPGHQRKDKARHREGLYKTTKGKFHV